MMGVVCLVLLVMMGVVYLVLVMMGVVYLVLLVMMGVVCLVLVMMGVVYLFDFSCSLKLL